MRTRAVLLDALGTLVTLEDPAPVLQRELRERFELDVTADQARTAITAEITCYREHLLDARDYASLARLRERCAIALRDELPLEASKLPIGLLTDALLASLRFRVEPDVLPALRDLRNRGLRMIVVSNWDVSLHGVLRELGVARLVNGVLASAELGVPKPEPAVFRHALALAGVPASEAIHVGDSQVEDIDGARSAGIRGVLIDRSGGGGEGAISSLAEVAPLVAGG